MNEATSPKPKGETTMKCLTEMSIERKKEIEEFAKEYGFSFASAKAKLEEIESDYDPDEFFAEVWY